MKQYIELQVEDYTVRGYEQGDNTEACLVMFHGYTGNKTESKSLFRDIADGLDEAGITTLRFDWLGHGESDLKFEEITVPLLQKQGQVVLEYAKNKYKTVYLLGFSMGGFFAMNAVNEDIEKLILIAPATLMSNIAKEAFQDDNQQFADIGGYLLSREFAEGFKDVDTVKNLKQYQKEILILQGDRDEAVPMRNTVKLKNALEHVDMHVFAEADHCFQKHRYHDQIIDTISEFLTK